MTDSSLQTDVSSRSPWWSSTPSRAESVKRGAKETAALEMTQRHPPDDISKKFCLV